MKSTGLSIGNAIAIGTVAISSLAWGISQYVAMRDWKNDMEARHKEDHRKILILEDRVYALANPEEQSSIDYWKHSHRHDYE